MSQKRAKSVPKTAVFCAQKHPKTPMKWAIFEGCNSDSTPVTPSQLFRKSVNIPSRSVNFLRPQCQLFQEKTRCIQIQYSINLLSREGRKC